MPAVQHVYGKYVAAQAVHSLKGQAARLQYGGGAQLAAAAAGAGAAVAGGAGEAPGCMGAMVVLIREVVDSLALWVRSLFRMCACFMDACRVQTRVLSPICVCASLLFCM